MYCYQIGQKITGNSWSEDDSVSDGGDGASSALHLSCLPSGLQPPRFPRSSRVPTDHLALGGTQTAWWSQTDTFLFFSLLLTLLEIPHWIPIRSDSCPPPWSPPPQTGVLCRVEDVAVFTVGGEENASWQGRDNGGGVRGVGSYCLMRVELQLGSMTVLQMTVWMVVQQGEWT